MWFRRVGSGLRIWRGPNTGMFAIIGDTLTRLLSLEGISSSRVVVEHLEKQARIVGFPRPLSPAHCDSAPEAAMSFTVASWPQLKKAPLWTIRLYGTL